MKKSRNFIDGRKIAFRCDDAFADVRTKEETADCMHALIFFTCNPNIASKMKMLSFNSLAPNTRFERLTYDSKHQFCEL